MNKQLELLREILPIEDNVLIVFTLMGTRCVMLDSITVEKIGIITTTTIEARKKELFDLCDFYPIWLYSGTDKVEVSTIAVSKAIKLVKVGYTPIPF